LSEIFKYTLDEVRDPKNLTKLISKFKGEPVSRFERLERYYRVKNDIKNRAEKDGKPNNKLAHGFAKYITKMATGYFMGKGIKYIISDDEQYKSDFFAIIDDNYTDKTHFKLAKEASKKGVAFELLYIDEKSRLRTEAIDAEEVIPVYSQKIGEFLECAVRIWDKRGFDDKITEYAELYTPTEILTYSKPPNVKKYRLDDSRKHGLADIPIIIYWNNEEQAGDYEDVISLIDAYDTSQSDTANDSEYFSNAYFFITGAFGGITNDGHGGGADGGDGEDEDTNRAYRTMRRERVLHIDEKGQAGFITKDINDKAEENFKTRLYKDIFFISQVPAMSDETFAGNLSGIAIRYKFAGLDELTQEKEQNFTSAQKKKIKIITDFINTKQNKNYEPDAVKIKIEFNLIENETEIINNVRSLSGIISHETMLELLPFIKDVADEVARIAKERNLDFSDKLKTKLNPEQLEALEKDLAAFLNSTNEGAFFQQS